MTVPVRGAYRPPPKPEGFVVRVVRESVGSAREEIQ
jgi:hypothetical protein